MASPSQTSSAASSPPPRTIIDYLFDNVECHGDRCWMTQPMGNGKLLRWTFCGAVEEAKIMAGYIQSLRLPERSNIAICSQNCAWWIIADLAIWLSGHVSVPILPFFDQTTTRHIIKHSDLKAMFVGKIDQQSWNQIKNFILLESIIVSKKNIILFPRFPKKTFGTPWNRIRKNQSPIEHPVERSLHEMATIIYTSGTTGIPKGVMTSFQAMTSTTTGIINVTGCNFTDRYLSYLPLAHGTERWLGECVPMVSGAQIYFTQDSSTFIEDIKRCQPTLFFSVPRLWSKYQEKVYESLLPEHNISQIWKHRTLKLGLKVPILKSMVRKKVLDGLGLGQVRFAGSGTAPLPPNLGKWYRKLGLQLMEGYGMTETFNYSHVSRFENVKLGYVGSSYADVQHKLDVDGEILIKSPGLMMGYYKDPYATQALFTHDGWFRTGDKGDIDSEGRLRIIGRKNNDFMTLKGVYISPTKIESLLLTTEKIKWAFVIGHAAPQPFGVVYLSEYAKELASRNCRKKAQLEQSLQDHLDNTNSQLARNEALAFIVIMNDDDDDDNNGNANPEVRRVLLEEKFSYYNLQGSLSSGQQRVIWH